jgi:hypothetical protein
MVQQALRGFRDLQDPQAIPDLQDLRVSKVHQV